MKRFYFFFKANLRIIPKKKNLDLLMPCLGLFFITKLCHLPLNSFMNFIKKSVTSYIFNPKSMLVLCFMRTLELLQMLLLQNRVVLLCNK